MRAGPELDRLLDRLADPLPCRWLVYTQTGMYLFQSYRVLLTLSTAAVSERHKRAVVTAVLYTLQNDAHWRTPSRPTITH